MKYFFIIFLLVGCSNERIITVEYKKILIPKSLLIPARKPSIPKEKNEAEISKYILELYKTNKINENNIYQIRRIVEKYNKKSYSKKKDI